jgi:maltose alpha-D-glucosyltransferase/alpha-amylase
VPFLIEFKGAGVERRQDFAWLQEMRDFLQWRCRDGVLLAEANVLPRENAKYFGERGERLTMMLNFPVNQRLFYAFATGDVRPLQRALEDTRERPEAAQWVHFLRSHDELDLGRLTESQRAKTFAALGRDERMQLYGRGIRRRLAPMLGNDRRRLELAFSVLFTLPGTPMLQFGDEIGLGDDLSLPERESARTPMQWSDDRHGGFSRARRTVRPVIKDPVFGYRRVNVAAQRRDPDSLLNWMERAIRMRRECPEIPWGDWTLLETRDRRVLAMQYRWRGHSIVAVHNFAPEPCQVSIRPTEGAGVPLVSLLSTDDCTPEAGRYPLLLEPYGYRWYRLGGLDRNVPRTIS